MSIRSEIQKLKDNISSAYTAVGQKGGTVPQSKTAGALAGSIQTVPDNREELGRLKTYIQTFMERGLWNINEEAAVRDYFFGSVHILRAGAWKGMPYSGVMRLPNCEWIDDEAFSQWYDDESGVFAQGYSRITAIIAPKCVGIGISSLYDMPYLTSVDLPSCVNFGMYCMNWCERLTSVKIRSVTMTQARELVTSGTLFGDNDVAATKTVYCKDGNFTARYDDSSQSWVLENL